MALSPPTVAAARELLSRLGAPPRLLRHVELVGEAAELVLSSLSQLGLEVESDLVRVGVALHDAGKILHADELDRPGGEHEPAGEALLLAEGVSPELARICLSHARWASMTVSLEELLVALADKLWKGVRKQELEERVVTEVATRLGKERWSLFIELDGAFESIAAGGTDRLERSRV